MNNEHPSISVPNTFHQRLDLDFAFQAAELGIWELDPVTNLVNWDDTCRQLFGLAEPNRLPYEQAVLYIHPQDVERVKQAVEWTMDPRSEGRYDQTYRTLGADDGQLRWVRFRGRAYFTATGAVYRFAGIAQEVTHQVVAQQALIDSEARLRTIIQQAPVATCLFVTRALVIEMANEAMIQVWGKGAEVIGKPLGEALPELNQQHFLTTLDHLFTTGESLSVKGGSAELVIDGRLQSFYFDYDFKPLRNAEGEVYAILETATDVTQQVQAQQVLQRSEARQRFLLTLSDRLRELADPAHVQYEAACVLGQYLGASRVGYAEDQGDGQTIVVTRNYVHEVADLEGRYQYADFGSTLLADFLAGNQVVRPDIAQDPTLSADEKEAHRLLQLGATVNKPLVKEGRLVAVLFIHYQQAHAWTAEELELLDETAQRTWAAVELARSQTNLRQSEERYRTLAQNLEQLVQQRTQELEATNQALTNKNDDLAHLTQDLERAIADLMRSNQNLEQFAYIASHDLQEPLRKIEQFGELLKSQYATQLGSGISYIDRMQTSAKRMSGLIRDLLTYSRIATGPGHREPVVLDKVLSQVVDNLSVAIEESGAQFQLDPLPTVVGDEGQLGQLFQNLLSNALKFRRTNASGELVTPHIEIRISQIAHRDLPAGVQPVPPVANYYRIEVTDNGIGFDEQHRDRIFQVFQRLHGKGEYAGSGVGLSIVQKVVLNHGGAIRAHSQPGQGATFQVYLPV